MEPNLFNLYSNTQKPTLSQSCIILLCFATCIILYPHGLAGNQQTNDAHLTGEDAVETQRCGEVPEIRAEEVTLYTLNSRERQ